MNELLNKNLDRILKTSLPKSLLFQIAEDMKEPLDMTEEEMSLYDLLDMVMSFYCDNPEILDEDHREILKQAGLDIQE
jgi:hypothetical protein